MLPPTSFLLGLQKKEENLKSGNSSKMSEYDYFFYKIRLACLNMNSVSIKSSEFWLLLFVKAMRNLNLTNFKILKSHAFF